MVAPVPITAINIGWTGKKLYSTFKGIIPGISHSSIDPEYHLSQISIRVSIFGIVFIFNFMALCVMHII